MDLVDRLWFIASIFVVLSVMYLNTMNTVLLILVSVYAFITGIFIGKGFDEE